MKNKIFYVYAHKKATDNTVFYIGKGKLYRAASKSGRSKHWHNIVNKHGYKIEILHKNLTENEAYQNEINEIFKLKELGLKLCNISNGGDGGLSGIELTKDHKEKLRKAHIGKPQLPDHAAKSRIARLGKKNTIEHTEKTIQHKRKKVINSSGEIFSSTCDAAREITKRTGLYASQGNISMCARGERNNAYGFSWDYDITKIPVFKPTKYQIKKVKCSNGMEFSSVQEAKKWVISWRGNAVNQCISNASRKGRIAYGYKWSY